MRTFITDLQSSTNLFTSLVWSQIAEALECDEAALYQVEGCDDDPLYKLLDQAAGIDFIAQRYDGRVITLSSRVQPQESFETFTVRVSRPSGNGTEFAKRAREIELDLLRSNYTVQAYVTPDKIVSAICRTDALIRELQRQQLEKTLKLLTTYSGERFAYETFDNLLRAGVAVQRFEEIR